MDKQTLNGVWQQLKQRPLLYHLLLILLVLLLFVLLSVVAMQMGTRHGARRIVPELTGILLSEAQTLAQAEELELIVNDSLFVPAYEGGVVLAQLPAQGVEVKPGRKVYITINSFSHKMVPLPYVAGRSLRQAKNMLEIAGLEIEELVYRPDMATNYVLEQRYKGEPIGNRSKVMAEAGSGVVLYVGVAAEDGGGYVPQVVGQSEHDAKSRLWENGFNVGEVHYDEGINLLNRKEARVYKQSPDLGTPLSLGRRVTLWLTLDEELIHKNVEAATLLANKLLEERLRQEALADSLARLQPMETERIEQAESELPIMEVDEFFE